MPRALPSLPPVLRPRRGWRACVWAGFAGIWLTLAPAPASAAPTTKGHATKGQTTHAQTTNETTGAEHAVVVNILGPTLTALGSAALPAIGLGDGAFVLNPRIHLAVTPGRAWTLTPTVAWISAAYDTWTVGVKGGPRFSGRSRWLGGWYLHPFAALGWIHVRPLREGAPAAAEGIDGISLGAGVEGGYSFLWDSGFALELGLGLGYTTAISFGDDAAVHGFRPVLQIGVGYAW